MLEINRHLTLPEQELTFTASRSSGPGGQHVNKSNTRVTLSFDVGQSPFLTLEQREKILSRLENRISKDGTLQISVQDARSQRANREIAIQRFVDLLRSALKERPPRKRKKISRAAHQRRLDKKRRRSEKKETRKKVEW
ncbi:aminoacyl-tRNA hydrolase [candidate division KSB1 bacterium]|nr:aminoacyl-tRNA hydrolase [candidate division KSB1 bacterium]